LPLSDASAIKLTIGAYYTPSGKNLTGNGIEPDIDVSKPGLQMQRALEILKGIISTGNQG
jgi:C-terminal processing protease CtpA/Prc